ncbi:MAG: tRNA (adenosine(37)-N6)-dimethylallyltransferase MiaA [Candidatus Azobacteroides sp.]|nr:tRNA (adenosine(37)-N6)-dimethylallyltransferase MiaA [Candidatus Azobacteroides sp.]
MNFELITILGPTASGKTSFAAALAAVLETEIISADSRQIYKRMDIGTGKDLDDYIVNGKKIPYHLIDICEPGYQYNIFEYQRDFFQVFNAIRDKQKTPVLCGGSGLYIESVLNAYRLLDVPQNPELREKLKDKTLSELESILRSYKKPHNSTDWDTAQRAIRAIEIEEYYLTQKPASNEYEPVNSLIIGVSIDRDSRRQKISSRLKKRLDEGMIEEVQSLLNSGLSPDDLIYYGLEYKFLTQYITGQLSYQEMFDQLEIAIHQFAKRQMTWFRGMERRGFQIHWIDALLPTEEKIKLTKQFLKHRDTETQSL